MKLVTPTFLDFTKRDLSGCIQAVNALRNGSEADMQDLELQLRAVIRSVRDAAFLRAFIKHACNQVFEFESDVLYSHALSSPMSPKSLLFGANDESAERHLLGKIGCGRITVDELVVEIQEARKPLISPGPKILISYSDTARRYGVVYHESNANVEVGIPSEGSTSSRTESETTGYISYEKLDAILNIGFDTNTVEVFETRNGYAIVRI